MDKEVKIEARKLFQEWLKLWWENKIQEAISEFMKALTIEEDWSYLNYEIWYSYILLEEYEKAIEYYKKVIKIEPKWFFSVITETYILEKIIDGSLPKENYKKFLKIFDTPIWTVKEWLCEEFLKEYPNFGIMYAIYIETLVFNLNLEKAFNIIEKIDSFDMDIDSKMYIKLSTAIIYILLWDKKKAKECLYWIYRSDTSQDIDAISDFILKNLLK